MLEIIAKGEVAQHLKERAVACRLSDILNIAGTDTFLASRNAALAAGSPAPVKYGFSGAMPALISRRLLSLCGTSEKLFITR